MIFVITKVLIKYLRKGYGGVKEKGDPKEKV